MRRQKARRVHVQGRASTKSKRTSAVRRQAQKKKAGEAERKQPQPKGSWRSNGTSEKSKSAHLCVRGKAEQRKRLAHVRTQNGNRA